MDNAAPTNKAIVLTDVAGEHFWTTSQMFCPIQPATPLPGDVQVFATVEAADREIALQAVRGIHLRRRIVNYRGANHG